MKPLTTTTSKSMAIIGGSNSVIKTGYRAELPGLLERAGYPVTIRNFAIGANTSIRGLMDAIALDRAYDIIIIEYFVNDYNFFNHYGAQAWKSSYEAILRLCRKTSPDAVIALPLIGRRDERFWPVQNRIRAEIVALAAAYGAIITDIDAELHTYGGDVLAPYYKDGSHLAAGLTAGYAGATLALDIAAALQKEFGRGVSPVTPLSDFDLSTALIRDIPPVKEDGDIVEFSNSAYRTRALRLGEGESLELACHGRPLCLTYVTSPDSGDLVITRADGAHKRIHTLHDAILKGKFAFMLRSINLMDKGWAEAAAAGSLKLEARRAETGALIAKEYNMIPNADTAPSSVYLLAWMHMPD